MRHIRPFGVEIEMNGTGRLRQIHNKKTNTVIIDGLYDFEVPIELPIGWNFVQDGSCGLEFVSPPTTDDSVITSFVKVLLNASDPNNPRRFARSFHKTGLHIHVGAADFSEEDVLNTVRLCRFFDRAIFAMVSPSRIANQFCRMIGWKDDRILKNIKSGGTRYRGCNAAAYYKHGTIEYRYPRGTLRTDRITAYIELFVKLTDLGKAFVGNDALKCKPNTNEKIKLLHEMLELSPTAKAALSAPYNDGKE